MHLNVKNLIAIGALVIASLVPTVASAGGHHPPPPSKTVCLRLTATIVSDSKNVYGTDGNDVIISTRHEARVYAGKGNDTVCAYGKGARVWGGDGNDVIKTYGGWGRLWGGNGNDTLAAVIDHNRLDGGAGTDRCHFEFRHVNWNNCESIIELGGDGSVNGDARLAG